MKLFDQNHLQITVTGRDGIQYTDHNIVLRFQPTAGGTACYANGIFPKGLAAKESIVIRPQEGANALPFVAINHYCHFWCKPAFGDHLSQLPAKTQMLLTKKHDLWHCILPVCADTFKTILRGGPDGMEIVVYSDFTGLTACNDQLLFLYETGNDPFALVRSITEGAAKLLNNGLKMREQRQMDDIFRYLGWCSWDAMQLWVNEDGLREKAEEFKAKNVPVKFAIIDDCWQDAAHIDTATKETSFDDMCNIMHESTLDIFDGRPHRFPKGIRGAVEALHEAGIPHVGVWFPTNGYWNGFTHDGPDAKWLKSHLFYTQQKLWFSAPPPEGGTLLVKPTEEAAVGYFTALCERIKSWGADFVKIDNQSSYDYYKEAAPIGQSSRNIQYGIEKATADIMDGALINCMGMSSECMFNRADSAISRCSSDFMPEDRVWFGQNVLQSSYNGLLQGQYYVNDWDMWWTDDEQAVKNSLCHAISGGPVYVSDKQGRTNPEILKPMCYLDGRVPMCDISATPTADCLLRDPTTTSAPFKLRNLAGDSGLIAAYNIHKDNQPVSGTVCPEDAGLAAGTYAYYEYFTKQSGILQPGEKLELSLDDNDAMALYTFVPAKDVTVLGRTDLFVGICAVLNRSCNEVTLYEGGQVSFVSQLPIRVLCDGQELEATRNGLLTTVTCAPHQTKLTFEKI